MLSVLSKRRALALSACAAFALASAPSYAQTKPATAPAPAAAPKKTDPPKKDKPETKPAEQTQAEQQAQAKKREETVEEKHEDKHDEEKEADRAVYMSFDLAFTRVDIGGISDGTGFDKTGANGLLYGLAAGLRLKDFRFGARWRVFDTTEYALWSLGGSVGYGLPLRPLSPVLTATLAYVWDQKIASGAFSSSLPRGTVLPPDVDVNGVLVGLEVFASYWLTQFLRAGPFLGTDLMFLSRERAALPQSIFPIPTEVAQKPLYTESGHGIAYTINIGLRGAFDVGF